MLRLRFCHESSWAFMIRKLYIFSIFREFSQIIFDCSLLKFYDENHYKISKHVFVMFFFSDCFAATHALSTASDLLSIHYDHISIYSQLYDCKQHYESVSSLKLHLFKHRLWVCTAHVVQRRDQSIINILISKSNNDFADQLLKSKWHHHINIFVKNLWFAT